MPLRAVDVRPGAKEGVEGVKKKGVKGVPVVATRSRRKSKWAWRTSMRFNSLAMSSTSVSLLARTMRSPGKS